MNEEAIEDYILQLTGTQRTVSDGKKLAIYEYLGEMFALVEIGKQPVRLSLRCDKRLGELLKQEYDEVLPGHKLNKDKWITVILTGQLKEQEIKALIDLSYRLIKEGQS